MSYYENPTEGGPTEEAGVAKEDIILEINNQETTEIEDLGNEVPEGKNQRFRKNSRVTKWRGAVL